MANDLNKVMLIGRLGRDPESRAMPSGETVCNFSIATGQSWKDKETQEKVERTEWHRISTFGGLAKICAQYLKKGSQVFIEGELRTRKWQDKSGADRYSTEIIASQMQMLGGKPSGEGAGNTNTGNAPRQQSSPQRQPTGESYHREDRDDDIPF